MLRLPSAFVMTRLSCVSDVRYPESLAFFSLSLSWNRLSLTAFVKSSIKKYLQVFSSWPSVGCFLCLYRTKISLWRHVFRLPVVSPAVDVRVQLKWHQRLHVTSPVFPQGFLAQPFHIFPTFNLAPLLVLAPPRYFFCFHTVYLCS